MTFIPVCPDTPSYTLGLQTWVWKAQPPRLVTFHLFIIYLLFTCYVLDLQFYDDKCKNRFSLSVLSWISLCGHVFIAVPWIEHGRIKFAGIHLCKMNRMQVSCPSPHTPSKTASTMKLLGSNFVLCGQGSVCPIRISVLTVQWTDPEERSSIFS